ncbi:MAG: hypothetical protein ACK5LV_01255 [Lachnospirales bacterium]
MSILKNVMILFLVVITVYQTISVWDISGDGFFEFSFNQSETIKSQDMQSFGMPNFIYKYEEYSDSYVGVNFSDYSEAYIVEYILGEVQKRGSNYTVGYLEPTDLKKTVFVFEYPYSLEYKDLINSVLDDTDTNENFVFDMIYLIKNEENYTIKFVSKETNMSNSFDISQKKVNLEVFLNETFSGFKYIASMTKYNSHNNLFIPMSENESNITYENLETINPYATDGEFILSDISRKISGFFENDTSVWSRIEKDSFMFSGDNVILKYYSDDIMEVAYYGNEEDRSLTFVENYALSLSFLKQDEYIENEIYLKSYEVNENKYTFNFDYKIAEFLIDIPSSYDLDSHLQVVVENGKITNYRKLVYNYNQVSDNENEVARTYESLFVNNKNVIGEVEDVKDVELVYKDRGRGINLCWKINSSNGEFYFDVY